jgi:hypothetical protein
MSSNLELSQGALVAAPAPARQRDFLTVEAGNMVPVHGAVRGERVPSARAQTKETTPWQGSTS